MAHYPFVTVDVFTDRRFGGNPLAVVTDAKGLTSHQMQAIATEFGYSETTFVLPPDKAAHTARVRIFTPTTEVPFAGHPNVGTAFVLGNRPQVFGRAPGDRLTFEEDAGLVHVDLERAGGHVTSATIRAPRPLDVGGMVDAGLLARCVSIAETDIETGRHGPRFLSVGLKFVVAELAGLEALARARPELSFFEEARRRHAEEERDFSVFLYVRADAVGTRLRARMFAPLDNVAEDPATGSASAALGAYLAHLAPQADGVFDIVIEQGLEMGRPSTIGVRTTKSANAVEDVRVAGTCVAVMSGVLEI